MRRIIVIAAVLAMGASLAWAAKSMSSTQSAVVNAPADRVWAVIVAPDNWADDNPAVAKARLVKSDGEAVGSVIKFRPVVGGKKGRAKLVVTVSEKNRKIEYKVEMPGVQSIMGFILEEKNGVTTLTNYEKASGPILKMISQQEMDEERLLWVQAVKKRVEGSK